MKILITGATGYLGLHLVKAMSLIPKNKIYCLVRHSSSIEKLPAGVFKSTYDGTYASLESLFADVKFDLVIHTAAFSTYETNRENIAKLVASNLELSTYLLQAMAEFGCCRLINTGTFWQHYMGASYNPVCLYAAMKQAIEDIIEYYVQAYSFKVITLKITDVYGPNDPRKKLFSLLKNSGKNKADLFLSEGEQLINLLYIDDAIKAYSVAVEHLKCISEKSLHKRYFVANDISVSLKDIVKLYQSISQKNLNVFYTNPYRPREVMEPYIGEILTGWAPTTTIDQGIKNVISTK